MTPSECCEQLEVEGGRLAALAAAGGLDVALPTCPGWQLRHLLRHLGFVHRWAAVTVGEACSEAPPQPPEAEILRGSVADADLVEWFADGHRALLATLRGAPPGLRCWTFLPAPSPLHFWARRQAHETTIHRVDAELASGPATAIRAALAADGVDEMVMGFAARSARVHVPPGRRLALRATDTGDAWLLRAADGGRLAVARGDGDADGVAAGPAQALYLVLWNRAGSGELAIEGDASLLERWREDVRVTWH